MSHPSKHSEKSDFAFGIHSELPTAPPLFDILTRIIHVSVWALAVMMTLVIIFGVIDVGWMLLSRILSPPAMFLGMDEILELFGAFLAVLISIEIFVNIALYLREDVVHVKIVLATAFIAIARKVIILDAKETPPAVMYGVASLVLAMSIGYFLVVVYEQREKKPRGKSAGGPRETR